jgi:hypothetical protein
MAEPVSATVYIPEYAPAPLTRICEPSGRTLGSAATIPGRVTLPEAVLPWSEYAVATNVSRGGATARVDRAGSGDIGFSRAAQPAKYAHPSRLAAIVARRNLLRVRAVHSTRIGNFTEQIVRPQTLRRGRSERVETCPVVDTVRAHAAVVRDAHLDGS